MTDTWGDNPACEHHWFAPDDCGCKVCIHCDTTAPCEAHEAYRSPARAVVLLLVCALVLVGLWAVVNGVPW